MVKSVRKFPSYKYFLRVKIVTQSFNANFYFKNVVIKMKAA